MIDEPTMLDHLSRLQPLATLGAEGWRQLAPLCRHERVARNLDPFRLREWDGQVVYLLKGELKLEYADGSTEVLVGGTGNALLPLARGSDCPVATKAITDIELLQLNEDALDIVLTWNQLAASGAPALANGEPTDWRTMSGMFAAQNLTQGVFSSLPPAHIDALLGRFGRIKVGRGEVVVRQGEAGDYYYLIERGRCRVTRRVAGTEVELAELKEGDAFGEEALVADTTRNATVTMKTGGVLLRLAKADFVELLRQPLLHRLAPADALAHVQAGAIWLDVRFPAEYQQDGLAGSINIPVNELRQALPMLDAGKEYIAYCQTGRRSSAAAFLLSQRGFRACLLEGGLKALSATTTDQMTS